jgi:hypothetical protein
VITQGVLGLPKEYKILVKDEVVKWFKKCYNHSRNMQGYIYIYRHPFIGESRKKQLAGIYW